MLAHPDVEVTGVYAPDTERKEQQAALWIASRPASATHTYGMYRAEVIAAALNTLGLWLVAVWIFYEAFKRFTEPSEVAGAMTLAVVGVGLGVNVAAALVLRRSAQGSLNVQGAFIHVTGDLLGSIGVIAAGLLIIAFGWQIADPILGILGRRRSLGLSISRPERSTSPFQR